MTNVLMGMLKGTPWYVYGIFAYLMFIGIKSTKSYTVPALMIYILPIAMTIWIVAGLPTYQGSAAMSPYFCVGVVVGMLIGYILLSQRATVNREMRTVTFEGSWVVLPLLMSVFVVKYFFGYMHATNSQFIVNYPWVEFAVSGCIAGIFVGRLLHIFFKFSSQYQSFLARSKDK